jgi:peptide/nickel transport system substrate-binding protein
LASPRRFQAAILVALLVGAVTFLVWWSTSRTPAPIAEPPKAADFLLPRGGSLAGSLPANANIDEAIADLTAAPLYRVNRSTGDVEPWLAESSSTSGDHLVYTIKLRTNVLRADGTPLAAADVVGAFTAKTPAIAGKPVTARAIDPLTVEIAFPSPFAPGLRLLDTIPIPGYGPFILTERTPQGRATFARNPRYWRLAQDGKSLPYLDQLVLDATSARPDELDFNENIRPADYRALRKADDAGKLRLYDAGPGLDADALWMNLSPGAAASESAKPWLRRDEFRRAISAAIDRRAFCDNVFAGMCDPIGGPVTPASAAWFMPELPAAFDLKLARATLAELGLQDRNGDGVLDDDRGRAARFTVLVPGGQETIGRGASYLRDELKKVGIAIDISTLDPALLERRRQKGDYEAIYNRVTTHDDDPAMNLDFWLSSGSRHLWNTHQLKPATEWEARMDQLMLKQASTFDRVERVQLFADVQRTLAEHVPAIYFGAPYVYVATSMRTLNARPSRQHPALLWSAETLAVAPK